MCRISLCRPTWWIRKSASTIPLKGSILCWIHFHTTFRQESVNVSPTCHSLLHPSECAEAASHEVIKGTKFHTISLHVNVAKNLTQFFCQIYNGNLQLVQCGTFKVIWGEKVFFSSEREPKTLNRQRKEEPESDWGLTSSSTRREHHQNTTFNFTLQIYLRLPLSPRQKTSWLFVGGAQIWWILWWI